MSSGGLLKIRVDMISDRPHAMTNYQLQGTDGAYESSRGWEDKNKIWLRSHNSDLVWMNLEDIEEDFMPEFWREHQKEAEKSGHWGGDYFELLDFRNAIRSKTSPRIGIHEAMDMTLPGLLSQESASQNGTWVDVPDSRSWVPQ